MSAKYKIDTSELEKLEEKLKAVPGNVERIINGVLHKTGIEVAVDDITKRIPISKNLFGIRTKQHARKSKWSASDKGNLDFTIKAKGGAANKPGSFGYLIFPNDGRGPYNHVAQNFFEDGMEKATPKILEDLNDQVEKSIKGALA